MNMFVNPSLKFYDCNKHGTFIFLDPLCHKKFPSFMRYYRTVSFLKSTVASVAAAAVCAIGKLAKNDAWFVNQLQSRAACTHILS